jgi:hypothetical protein
VKDQQVVSAQHLLLELVCTRDDRRPGKERNPSQALDALRIGEEPCQRFTKPITNTLHLADPTPGPGAAMVATPMEAGEPARHRLGIATFAGG